MTTPKLVLSLFPGIDLLGRAFEECGFVVVRGPDVIWGGDVRTFHPPAGVFDGIIGGPPCQPFSPLVRMIRHVGHEPRHENLIPEFERVVAEARPRWFVMEESPFAPLPDVPGYQVHAQILNNRWLGEAQNRERRISFGTADGRRLPLQVAALEAFEWHHTVTSKSSEVPISRRAGGAPKRKVENTLAWVAGGRRLTIAEMLTRQGFPGDLLNECPLTAEGKRQAIGNGVPRAMGLTIARGILTTIYGETQEGAA